MDAAGIQIGETLRAARKRAGLEIAALEQRTRIRGRYLRALEDENWDDLPSETYARAFLRTYADELSLDADALCDELRLRQGGRVGGAEELITPPMGPEPRPSRWVVAALAGAIVVLLVVFAFAGREGDDEDAARDGRPAKAKQKHGGEGESDSKGAGPGKASLVLVPLTAARVCVASGGKALVARQILSEGNAEEFEPSSRYLVDLEFGEIRLKTLDERTRLRADSAGDPLTVVVKPGQVRRVEYSGDSCP